MYGIKVQGKKCTKGSIVYEVEESNDLFIAQQW